MMVAPTTEGELMDNRDVVIAGAGPVGLMLAAELRLAGVDVLVVERLTEIDPTIKAGGFNLPAAEAFYRRGLLPEFQQRMRAAFERFQTFVRQQLPEGTPVPQSPPKLVGHFAGIMISSEQVHFDDPDFYDAGPANAMMGVGQQDVEAVLGAYAAELGVPIRRGVTLTGFDADDTGVTVHLGPNVESVRAGWLVGCDGGRSLVRKLAGFDFPGTDPEITGHQAIVRMEHTEGLRPGWNRTDTGIYVHGPVPGRMVTVEVDGPPADRDAPITAAELQSSLRRTSGVPVVITEVLSATRFTDNARQATTYRAGRVLLAGDAAHVHSPFGGQGLNLGIGDAVNLGWKLAATVRGWAPEGLLDTYTSERHPIGEWVLEWTRAQVALMRTDPRSRALRDIVTDLLNTPDGATYLAKKLSGVLNTYDLGGGHPLVGHRAPDLTFADGTRLADHSHTPKALLLDLADDPTIRTIATGYEDRLKILTTKSPRHPNLTATLLRPDGYVAWATETANPEGLPNALTTWLGHPTP